MKTPIRRMGTFVSTALLAAGMTFAAAAFAQESVTRGTITGKVTDPRGVPISRASVGIAGTSLTTETDDEGRYYLADVPAGQVNLTASSVGYGDLAEPVDLAPGATVRRDFRVGSEIVQMGAMVVEGSREGQARALTDQKNATNLMTVVSSDAVGKFPDAYVGDALRRLVGIVVEEDQGEATGVTIRGIEPDFNNITINGQEVAATGTPGGGTSNVASRPVPLDTFSVDVIDSIEVAKATTPDMDGEGLGGAVNVKMKTAFSRGARELSASGEYTYADLGKGSEGYRGTLSYSDIFGSERNLGLLGAVTREKRDRVVQKVYGTQYSSTGLLQRSRANGYSQTLTRTSYMANFDYKFRPQTTISLKTQYSDYDDESGYNRAQIHADQGRYQNEFVRDHRFRKLYSLDLSGETRFGRNTLKVGGLYSYSDEDKPENQKHVFRTANNAVKLTFDQTDWIDPYPVLSTFTSGDGLPTTTAEKALFPLNEAKFRGNYQEETRSTFYADFTRDFELLAYPTKLKLGTKYTEHKKFDNAWAYVFGATSTILNYNYFPDQAPTKIRDHWNVYSLDMSKMLALFNGPDRDTYLAYNPQASISDSVVEDFSAKESVAALYASLASNIQRLRLEGGVRFERAEGTFTNYGYDENAFSALPTKAAFIGNGADPVAPYPNVIKVVKGKGSFTNYLPSIHGRYTITPDLIVHSAVSTNVGRPKFTDVAGIASFRASTNLDGSQFTLTTGNPNLKAATATSYDLTFSYYGLKPLGLFEFGGFYKTIDKRVYKEVTTRAATQEDYDRYHTATNGLDVGDPIDVVARGNAKGTKVYGLEADWRMELRFLPNPLNGLGVGANFTYAESEETIPYIQTLPTTAPSQPARAGQKVAFPMQARNSGSAYISFQKWGFDGRVAGTYTGRRLASWSDSNAANDQYWRARWRVDLIGAYALSRRWSVTASLINLTDDPAVLYTNPYRLVNSEFYGRTGRIGVRYFFR
jgi:TonB-dependent receptor